MTYHFCERFLDKRDRTHDQMLQAARSGKQNIVEGTVDKSSSYEMMIKLLNVSRGSHMELLEDFHDYLRVRKLRLWEAASKEVAAMRRLGTEHSESDFFINLAVTRSDETIANMIIVLLHQAETLTMRYIRHIEEEFREQGGIKEKMYAVRVNARDAKK
jgi:four helix bundle suffix protein